MSILLELVTVTLIPSKQGGLAFFVILNPLLTACIGFSFFDTNSLHFSVNIVFFGLSLVDLSVELIKSETDPYYFLHIFSLMGHK